MGGRRVLDVYGAVFLSLLFSCSGVRGADPVELTGNVTIAEGNRNYDGRDITVTAGCVLTIDGEHSFTSLTVLTGGTVTSTQIEARYRLRPRTAKSQDGMVLTIDNDMTVEQGAFVDVGATGHESGVGGGGTGIPSGGGGGHGGRGGDGEAAGGAAYDSKDKPAEVGGGGGNAGDYPWGGYGGGRVAITVYGTLLLNGEIYASGADGQARWGWIGDVTNPANYVLLFGGGGAGGAILLNAWTLSGNGSIIADGGSSGRCGGPAVAKGGGGGGGRIAIYYSDPNSEFSGTVSASGGCGAQSGEDGTVLVKGKQPFAVSIVSPVPDANYLAGKAIQFKASRTYGLNPSYMWSSNRDGELGKGKTLALSSLSEGRHTITLSSDDGFGAASKTTIDLNLILAKYAYRASVATDLTDAYAGTPVPMIGHATSLIDADDTPAQGAEVAIRVRTKGMERTITVRTDISGNFSTNWQPFDTEAGQYFISADRPDIVDEPAEDEFVLFGADIEPNAMDYRVLAGQRIERSVTIRNLGDVELSGLSARVENAPANLRIEPTCPSALDPGATALLKYSITPVDASVQDADFDVVVSHKQTPVAALHVRVKVVPAGAVFEARPREITAGMVSGDQTLVDFDVVNVGGSASDAPAVQLPADAAWMSLVTPDAIGSLEPNASTTMTLSLMPKASEAVDGNLAVSDGQTELTVPFRFDCVPTAVGGLTITAVDEFTFYGPGKPGVAGAHVTIVNAQTNELAGSADANDSGVAIFPDLPDTYYNVEVVADDHETFRTMLRVAAGSQTRLTAFLPRQLVTYRWTVRPGSTEGHYDFEVEAAPVPVVTVEPLSLNLCGLTQKDSQVNYTFTNHGLLAARDVKLAFKDFAGFEFTPLVDTIDLPAGTSIEVPVRIHNGNVSAGVPGPCDDGNQSVFGEHELSYRLRCGPEDRLYRIPFFAQAGDARVRMRIDHETVLAGDTFTVAFELANKTLSLDKVKLVLAIRGDDGTPIVVPPPRVAGIDDLNGDDSLPTGQSLAAEWLIPTAADAPCGEPRHYNISGELTYVVGGVTIRTPLYPASITVLPNPQLEVKYFLERDVHGDDPLADPVEAAVPFSLGMMVANHGCGTAGDVRMVSSQPTVIDGQQGRPIDFKITGTWVGRDAIAPVLNAKLGDIQPESRAVVHWLMQSSAPGRFEDYRAGFMHTDGLGDKQLAPVEEPPIYELSHVVHVTYPDDDGLPDFLTNSPQTHLPEAVHLSDGSVHPVANISPALSRVAVLGDHVYLTVPDVSADYFYVRFSDSSLSTSPLKAVTRSDGVAIPIGENAWTTHRLIRPQGQAPYEERLLHLFDYGGPGAYVLDYSGLPPLKVDVKYFLERRIYGDDPFTKEVEPAVPFSLAVIVRNQGYAAARDVWLIASPPRIVDQANQPLRDPNVIGVSVGPNEVSPSLQIKIGDLEVNESKMIRWVMESSFQGRLESWNVEFVQVDSLGARYPLDVSSVSVHELEHVVHATWSGDDGECDFLTREDGNTYGFADTLYLSDGFVWPEPVTGLVRMVHELVRIREHLQIRLAVVGAPDGPFYVRYPDPGEGKLKLVAVTRSDGVAIPVGPNAWTTHRIVREPPGQAYEENFLHLFDYGGPGSYTFEYELGDWKQQMPDEP